MFKSLQTKKFFAIRNENIIKDYLEAKTTVEKIALKYEVTPRSIQRIVKASGLSRTIAEANKISAKYKNYEALKIPPHLKAKRKTLPVKVRYQMIKAQPWCSLCKNTGLDCPLQIDHKDGDATNNDTTNLQVLCMLCNYGKK